MKSSLLRLVMPAFALVATLPQGQSADQSPSVLPLHQTLDYIKVLPGKGGEFLDLMRETGMVVAQARVDAGEIVSWTLLRAVMPAGEEARADFVISVINTGSPAPRATGAEFGERLKKAGSSLTWQDVASRRAGAATLVASELWRVRERVGAPEKGHYILLNSMRVHDPEAHRAFEGEIWRPVAAARVRDGSMSGWIYATKLLPGGAETPYAGYTADMYPSWEAIFADNDLAATFAKAHPGVSIEETFDKMRDLRTLARRELWIVEERVTKKR